METYQMEMTEFEEMRQQLNLLNEKLNKQSIINENIIRRTMRDKLKSIGFSALIQCVVAVFATPFCVSMYWTHGMSIAFCIVTTLFLLGAVIYTYWEYKGLRSDELVTGDLIQASQRVLRLKRLQARWLRFSIPFVICWLGWLITEIYLMSGAKEPGFFYTSLCGIVFGGTIGALWGTAFYRRSQRISNEVLRQIEELTQA